jgi:hypothetical protein
VLAGFSSFGRASPVAGSGFCCIDLTVYLVSLEALTEAPSTRKSPTSVFTDLDSIDAVGVAGKQAHHPRLLKTLVRLHFFTVSFLLSGFAGDCRLQLLDSSLSRVIDRFHTSEGTES